MVAVRLILPRPCTWAFYMVLGSQCNPIFALRWHSALMPVQRCCKCAVRHFCAMELGAGPVQVAALLPGHHCAHWLRWSSSGGAFPVEDLTEACQGCNRVVMGVVTDHNHPNLWPVWP